ncbi:MAG: hypothetical protein IPM54_13920 [Polyangiaceae bacterium]|nr:hypothetical protein [Polyangiaceae bacterium]
MVILETASKLRRFARADCARGVSNALPASSFVVDFSAFVRRAGHDQKHDFQRGRLDRSHWPL